MYITIILVVSCVPVCTSFFVYIENLFNTYVATKMKSL